MTKKLWGGRFIKPTNKLVEDFSNSIHFDHQLAKYDVLGSLAHIRVLKKARLLSPEEYQKLTQALNDILQLIINGKFQFDSSFEDIHSYIQHLVEKKAGPAGLKLHTCRSRNDQVTFDLKAYTLEHIAIIERDLDDLEISLSQLVRKNQNIILPGFTHLQHAIPVLLSEHLGAYIEMFKRDHIRLYHTSASIKLTLGAGALAGTFIPSAFYRQTLKPYLPLDVGPCRNSIDSVSDRDFVIETLSTLAIVGLHLSRLAEDMVLWASKEFDFIDIDDAFCTGSSLMPQKKNPDVLELIRGNTGRLYGNLVNVLVVMKGLPLSYNRDMQMDKEPLFDSVKTIQNALTVLTELIKNLRFKPENIKKQLADESLFATDIADYLVKQGIAFKTAHHLIGQLIGLKIKTKTNLRDMNDAVLKQIHPSLNHKIILRLVDEKNSVLSKKSVLRKL